MEFCLLNGKSLNYLILATLMLLSFSARSKEEVPSASRVYTEWVERVGQNIERRLHATGKHKSAWLRRDLALWRRSTGFWPGRIQVHSVATGFKWSKELDSDMFVLLDLNFLKNSLEEETIQNHKKFFIDRPQFYELVLFARNYPNLPSLIDIQKLADLSIVGEPKSFSQRVAKWEELVSLRLQLETTRTRWSEENAWVLTQSELARRLGISVIKVSEILKFRSSYTSLEEGKKFASELGSPYEWLLGYDFILEYFIDDNHLSTLNEVAGKVGLKQSIVNILSNVELLPAPNNPVEAFNLWKNLIAWRYYALSRIQYNMDQYALDYEKSFRSTGELVSEICGVRKVWPPRGMTLQKLRYFADSANQINNDHCQWVLGFDFIRYYYMNEKFKFSVPIAHLTPVQREVFENALQIEGGVWRSATEADKTGKTSANSQYQNAGEFYSAWLKLVGSRFNSLFEKLAKSGDKSAILTLDTFISLTGIVPDRIAKITEGKGEFSSLAEASRVGRLIGVKSDWLLAYDFIRLHVNRQQFLRFVHSRQFQQSTFGQAGAKALGIEQAQVNEFEGYFGDGRRKEFKPTYFETSNLIPRSVVLDETYLFWNLMVAKRLRLAMEKYEGLKLNEFQVARRVGIESSIIFGIIDDHKPLTSIELGYKLAEELKVPPEWLLGFDLIRRDVNDADLVGRELFLESHPSFYQAILLARNQIANRQSDMIADDLDSSEDKNVCIELFAAN